MKLYTTDNEREKKFLVKPVKPVDFARVSARELRALVKLLREEMTRAQGVGLSANQLGLDTRVFVADVPMPDGTKKFYAVVNPRITKYSKETEGLEEACLSVPHMRGIVARAKSVTLEGFAPSGKKLKLKAWGFLAQVFQHETDHLDGHLFTEKATALHRVEEDAAQNI